MKKLFYIMFSVVVFLLVPISSFAEESNLKVSNVETSASVDQVSRRFINNWRGLAPAIQTVAKPDGGVSVMSSGKNSDFIEIHEFEKNGEYMRSLKVKRELPLVGALTIDSNGNYYVLYGKEVAHDAFHEKNIALVKYLSDGAKVKEVFFEAKVAAEPFGDEYIYFGNRVPWNVGNCKLEISGNQIAAYFGKTQFLAPDGKTHQSSAGFILDLNSFERLTNKGNGFNVPFASHSFNQYLLPIDGGFMFVDHGDANPRSFLFTSMTYGKTNSIESFKFRDAGKYQDVLSELGGLSITKNGYIFVGTYEFGTTGMAALNGSRNIFVLTLDKDLKAVSEPILITDYNDKENENAIFPKIAQVGDDAYLLMWNKVGNFWEWEPSDEANRANIAKDGHTYYTLINSTGKQIKGISKLPNTNLNGFDTLRFNEKSGLVHWATENGAKGISLYSFDPYNDSGSIVVTDYEKKDVKTNNEDKLSHDDSTNNQSVKNDDEVNNETVTTNDEDSKNNNEINLDNNAQNDKLNASNNETIKSPNTGDNFSQKIVISSLFVAALLFATLSVTKKQKI